MVGVGSTANLGSVFSSGQIRVRVMPYAQRRVCVDGKRFIRMYGRGLQKLDNDNMTTTCGVTTSVTLACNST
jgi:hypothetical protein